MVGLWSVQMSERIAKDWMCVTQYLLELDQDFRGS